MTPPKRPPAKPPVADRKVDETPRGYTAEDALAALFTVRYPMAQDGEPTPYKASAPPAGSGAPTQRLTTEEVLERLKAQAPPSSQGSDMASEVPEDEPADEGDGDEEADGDCDDEEAEEEYEGNIEWDIAHQIVTDALDLGYSISVFDEEGWPLAPGRLERSVDIRQIKAALNVTEREFLRFTTDDGAMVGWVFLAWGGGRDMIGDYSQNDATVGVLQMAWVVSEADPAQDAHDREQAARQARQKAADVPRRGPSLRHSGDLSLEPDDD